MNATKMVQCSVCLVVLCGALRAAPAHWRENIVYQTTAGKAQPAVLLPGITSAVPPAKLPPPAQVMVTQAPPPAPAMMAQASPLAAMHTSATPALNKGTLSALQSAHDATATPLTTTTPAPVTRGAITAPVARGLSTTSKAAATTRGARTALRRASGSVDHFVDRNNDGYDDRASALDL